MPYESAPTYRPGYNRPVPYYHVSCNYSIHLMRPKGSGGPLPIPRLAGVDLLGTIEKGQSTDLAAKIWHFKGSVLGSSTCDTEGCALHYYFIKNKGLQKLYGTLENLLDCTRFSFVRSRPKDLRSNELRDLDKYISVLGEPPLANGQVPGVSHQAYRWPLRPEIDMALRWDIEKLPKRAFSVPLSCSPPSPLTRLSCVYTVYIMDRADPSKICQLNRFGRIDHNGILAIGQTRDLAGRMSQMRNNIFHPKRRNEWGLLRHIFDVCPTVRRRLGPKKDILDYLHVSYIETEPSLLMSGEACAFDDYIGRYAELPPLNCQIPMYNRPKRK